MDEPKTKQIDERDGNRGKPENAPEKEPIAIEEPIEPGDPDGQPI